MVHISLSLMMDGVIIHSGNKMKLYKSKKRIELLILSAIAMLMALLFSIHATGAWFTSGDGLKVECTVTIGKFNLQLWQNEVGSGNRVYSVGESSNSYVDLTNSGANKVILPDTNYGLTLKLYNADKGTDSFKLRYKINLIKCGKSSDTVVDNVAISGVGNEFVASGGWYYYGSSASSLKEFEYGTTVTIITGFSIPYSEYYEHGFNGDNIKIDIVVECTSNTSF